MSYSIRVAESRDVPRVLSLLQELHGGRDPRARFEWMYRANPSGEARTLLAIETASGEAVGMASLFPWRMSVGGSAFLAGLGGDDYVRPAHRRRGIAASLHLACRMALEGWGFSFVFGTPTAANDSPLAAAGTRNVTTVQRFTAPAALLRAMRPAWRIAEAGVSVSPATPSDARVDELWTALSASHRRIGTIRDAAFFEWRFRKAPSALQQAVVVSSRGRPFAVCALERRDHRLRLVDLLASPDDVPRALRAIVSLGRFDALETRASVGQADALRFWSYGFVPREQMPLNVMLPSGRENGGDPVLHDAAQWSFSWADTDMESTWAPAPIQAVPGAARNVVD